MGRLHAYPRRRARAGAGIAFEVLLAEGGWARTIGLLAEPRLDPGLGLLIRRCSSVHTFGMRFAIDVAFVRWPPTGAGFDVLSVAEGVRPWRAARLRRRGTDLKRREVAALELAAGEAGRLGLVAGEPVAVGPATPP